MNRKRIQETTYEVRDALTYIADKVNASPSFVWGERIDVSLSEDETKQAVKMARDRLTKLLRDAF
jgi:hypothetical protein